MAQHNGKKNNRKRIENGEVESYKQSPAITEIDSQPSIKSWFRYLPLPPVRLLLIFELFWNILVKFASSFFNRFYLLQSKEEFSGELHSDQRLQKSRRSECNSVQIFQFSVHACSEKSFIFYVKFQ